MIEQKNNHVVEALDHLLEQFKDSTTLKKLVTVYVDQIQELEDAAFSVFFGRMIDYAVGVQLDGLGAIVGEPREGKDDDAYRLAIKVRILINISNGTPEEIVAVVHAATGGATVKIREYWPAAFIVEITDPVEAGFDAALVAVFVHEAKPAGVLAHLIYYPDNVFRFDTPGQGYDQGHYGGAV